MQHGTYEHIAVDVTGNVAIIEGGRIIEREPVPVHAAPALWYATRANVSARMQHVRPRGRALGNEAAVRASHDVLDGRVASAWVDLGWGKRLATRVDANQAEALLYVRPHDARGCRDVDPDTSAGAESG